MRWSRACSLVMLTVTLTACSASGNDAPTASGAKGGEAGDMIDSAHFRAALHQISAKYTWPADHRPDLDALGRQTDPGGLIGADGPRVVMEIINECAWDLSWLAARDSGDAAVERQALDTLTNVIPKLPTLDKSGRQFARDAATKARLGDPSLVQQFPLANCDNTKWIGK